MVCRPCRVSVSYRKDTQTCRIATDVPITGVNKMFSLIRKISSSQHARDNMAEQSKRDDDDDKHESEQQEQQQEEVDGTSYDPNADPRDPGRYYTFPHFAEE